MQHDLTELENRLHTAIESSTSASLLRHINSYTKDLEGDARFPLLPKADNGNYLWIQLFATALSETGRAGFVTGVCKVATVDEIEAQGSSLEKLASAHVELRELAARAAELEAGVDPVLTL